MPRHHSPLLLAALLTVAVLPAAAPAAGLDISVQMEMQFALQRGVDYLLRSQRDNGSWSGHPGITALVTIALRRSPQADTKPVLAAVARAQPRILAFAGSAPGTSPHRDSTHIYSTSVTLMALGMADRPEQAAIRSRIREYLRRFLTEQLTSGRPLAYDQANIPDISNIHWAMEALRLTRPEEDETGPDIWPRAREFIASCQVRSPQEADDGGFTYSPIRPAGHPGPVWGSLTCAGIKSLLFSGASPDDPRIAAAGHWLDRNDTLRKNPGLGPGGHFYYLYLRASANLLLETLRPALPGAPTAHAWRGQIVEQLLAMQKSEGEWKNAARIWLEADANLCTAYAILVMEFADAP